ncbi:MAG: 6-bladed beta-propeller [Melioribacteraceae bacterium]|nr:6-bladed beta-propeller [Melioribacteraceae bacterium]
MGKKQFWFILIVSVLNISCNRKENNSEIKLIETNKHVYDIFHHEKVLNIMWDSKNPNNIFSITKIVTVNDSIKIILDGIQGSLYKWNYNNNMITQIAKKGRGPGEFNSIRDFVFDDHKNLFVLDVSSAVVGKFDSNYNFIKNYSLSFEHRNPYAIGYFNNSFIISAQKNLQPKSTKKNYNFLDYTENKFVNIYDNEFNLIHSIISPDERLVHTQGVFCLPFINLSPFGYSNSNLYIMKQEGFYKIYIINKQWDVKKIIDVKSKAFKEIRKSDYMSLKINDREPNLKMEEIGKIVASYTSPMNILITKDFLTIQMVKPYNNYYPQYDNTDQKKYYLDVYKIINEGLYAYMSNISIDAWIIGADYSTNVLYSSNSYTKIENEEETYIETIQLK